MELRIALDIDAKQVSYLVNQLARMGFVEKHADSFSDHGRIINGTRV
jgi:DNA-binding MarR family transcriptional regulator